MTVQLFTRAFSKNELRQLWYKIYSLESGEIEEDMNNFIFLVTVSNRKA
jgi:hypothetical protein